MITPATLIVSVAVLLTASDGADYCKISEDHTMCKYHGTSPDCGVVFKSGISSQEADMALKEHNLHRLKIAQGNEDLGLPGPQPEAADMLQMEWDQELAAVAQRWADQCSFHHDDERSVDRFAVGQNLFHLPRQTEAKFSWSDVVQEWYMEVMDFDSKVAASYSPSIEVETGHYTQLVWSQARYVGCGAVINQTQRSNLYEVLAVCNYGPAGNIKHKPLYQIGPSCSACPENFTCSALYPGLCSARVDSSPGVSVDAEPRPEPDVGMVELTVRATSSVANSSAWVAFTICLVMFVPLLI